MISDDAQSLILAIQDSSAVFEYCEKSAFPDVLAKIKSGGKIITCGNGGSAATASHLTEELLGKYKHKRRPIASICLNSDGPALTCIANDFSFNHVFKRQLEALGDPKDVFVVFSTSGRSMNVLEAVTEASSRGIMTVGFLGGDGGSVWRGCTHPIIVKSGNSARIQEIHDFIMHGMLEYIENNL